MSENSKETQKASAVNKDTNDKNKGKRKKKKTLTGKQKVFKAFKITILVLMIMILLGGIVGGALAYSWIKDAPNLDMTRFEYIEPSVIVDKNGDFYQELQGKEKREIVTIDQIPELVQNAFISIEDERFETHNGVDIQGFTRAALEVVRTGSLSGPGGSTITQQLIKLTHLTPEKALERKIVEIYLAMELEKVFTKDQILEAYLNKINFAYAWGVQSASKVYFGKNVSELTVAQAASLASIIKSPTNYKPYIIEELEDGTFGIKKDEDGKVVYNEKNQSRALSVVAKMQELGHINAEEAQVATEQLKNNDFGLQEPAQSEIYSFFTDALYDQLTADLLANEDFNFESKEEAQNYLLNSGLTIHSTIDPSVQKVLDEKFSDDSLFPSQSSTAKRASEALSADTGEEVNLTPEGAMTIVENSTGHVVGMIGGRSKESSRSLNRATQKFQVGSSTKPLTVYGPGLESKKITLATTYDDQPILIGRNWDPGNAGESSYAGMTTIREGLRRSKNVIAVQAFYDIGVETSVKYAELLGLELVKEGDVNDLNASALSLGGYTYGQTTLTMASAFSTFPDQGVRTEPIMYTKISDSKGNVVLENPQEKIRVFSEQTAYLITDVLKTAVRGGTTSISVSGTEIAGKTGTTNEQMHAWFAGYSPYYSASVWYGYDQNKVVAGGKTYVLNIGLSGGSSRGPAKMWEAVMRDIHKDLESAKLPSQPSGIVTASVDRISGLLPTELTAKDPRGSTVISEKFISGTVPTESDDYHIEVRIDVSTGKVASDYCPEHLVETVVRILKPDDRFPSVVKPLRANYIPGPERGVLAPDLDDICTVHTGNSIVDLAILGSNGGTIDNITIEQGQSTTIRVRGVTQMGDYVDIQSGTLTVTPSTGNVSVTPAGSGNYTVSALSAGKGTITANITYEYKVTTGAQTETKTYSYSDTLNYTVTQANRPPQISLEYGGKSGTNISFEIAAGTAFAENAVKKNVSDPDGGNPKVTTSITFNGSPVNKVDTDKTGNYVLAYTATDNEGATAKATLTLTVK
ncbi:transglycosylase domain-containing protein [Alkalibacter mobilis]|uniref:transglycosylase domain-containing protein n=1 Tax=Alkalibacter mobilis TaxID=2787712 RepID=UPI00189D99D7|nr:transglycosylase domain-containing protein [Alkalibacter mobilis]MBF7095776.1 transglycosylase domain-containing protein [Alkalibacter mobilis]